MHGPASQPKVPAQIRSLEPSHLWIVGVAVPAATAQPRPATTSRLPRRVEGRPMASFEGPCECPDDCLRDHDRD